MNEIRFNLDDIINGELIEDILVSLRMIYNKSPIKKIHFWYDEVDEKNYSDFIRRFDDIFEIPLQVIYNKRTPDKEFVWFDVVSDKDNKKFNCCNRFSYIYPMKQKSKLLLGIHNFYQVYNYIETHPKSRRILYDKNKEK